MICLLQQALLRQALPDSGDGGVRTAAGRRLALVFLVIARRSNDLFVIFITFGFLCTVVDDLDWLALSPKKKVRKT